MLPGVHQILVHILARIFIVLFCVAFLASQARSQTTDFKKRQSPLAKTVPTEPLISEYPTTVCPIRTHPRRRLGESRFRSAGSGLRVCNSEGLRDPRIGSGGGRRGGIGNYMPDRGDGRPAPAGNGADYAAHTSGAYSQLILARSRQSKRSQAGPKDSPRHRAAPRRSMRTPPPDGCHSPLPLGRTGYSRRHRRTKS